MPPPKEQAPAEAQVQVAWGINSDMIQEGVAEGPGGGRTEQGF